MNDERIELIRHADEAGWIQAVADEMGALLEQEISARGQARMLLSGGTTPAPIYEMLANRPLDWSKVEAGLVDERWLSPQDPSSNAWLVEQSLLQHADGISFAPLVRPGQPIEECVRLANLQADHGAAACVAVLGMGNDGHTASLFPGSRDLQAALDAPTAYAALDATGCPGSNQWPLRITLTRAGLAATGVRLLLLRGEQKLQVLQAALSSNDPLQYPILNAIDLAGPRLRVHWCP